MMRRKTTLQWEGIKSQCTMCLCYSESKGLHTRSFLEDESSEDILYRPHGFLGFVKDTFTIPEKNLEICIMTNFGYGRLSYLKATIKKGNRYILNFDITKLYQCDNHRVTTFDAPLYDWNYLFEIIVRACKKAFTEDYTISSIAYIRGLSDMLEKDRIIIKSYEGKRDFIWEGDFLVTLFAGRKIQYLLEGLDFAKVSDQTVKEHTLDLCRNFLQKVLKLDFNFSDSRIAQISETIMLIHQFMCKNEAGMEYLDLIFNKNDIKSHTYEHTFRQLLVPLHPKT